MKLYVLFLLAELYLFGQSATPPVTIRCTGSGDAQICTTSPVLIPSTAPLLPPTMTFSGEGAEPLNASAGKVIHGVQLVNVTICNTNEGTISFSGGAAYQAASTAGFQPIGPVETRLLLTRTAALNWRSTIATGAPLVAGVMTALVGGHVLCSNCASKVQNQITVGAALVTGNLGLFQQWIAGRAPNPTSTLSNLIDVAPNTNQFAAFSLAGGSCLSGKLGAKYPGP